MPRINLRDAEEMLLEASEDEHLAGADSDYDYRPDDDWDVFYDWERGAKYDQAYEVPDDSFYDPYEHLYDYFDFYD